MGLTNWQRQIVIGTVLGGSSIIKPPKGKNCYLSMRDVNPQWLEYKIQELAEWFKCTVLMRQGNTFRCNSVCSPIFTELQSSFYTEKRRVISKEILEPLQDIGLAVWWLDGGNKTGRDKRNAYLSTTRFGEAGSKLIADYFNDEMIDMPCRLNRGNQRLRVLFTVQGTERLLSTIAHRFPTFILV